MVAETLPPGPNVSEAPQGQSPHVYPFARQHQVALNEDIQVAHRLFNMPGKCQNIHGHSMNVTLILSGKSTEQGVFQNLDFADMKDVFRKYLKDNFDHRLLLNKNDPWAQFLYQMDTGSFELLRKSLKDSPSSSYDELQVRHEDFDRLPGLQLTEEDPTTENLCYWMYCHFRGVFELPCRVTIQETKSNAVSYGDTF